MSADLEKNLRELGFPLLEASTATDVNRTLADVVQSQDARYWEGFPLLLANAAKQPGFRYDRVEQYFTHPDHRQQFKQLYLMSLSLYKVLNLKFPWASFVSNSNVEMFKEFTRKLADNQPVEVAGRPFYPQRLKEMFTHYYQQEAAEVKALGVKQEELSLEYAFSQVFSPKQKELFKKKLKGELLTKTEREYFSRTVKKKVLALANPDLHRLAQKVLE